MIIIVKFYSANVILRLLKKLNNFPLQWFHAPLYFSTLCVSRKLHFLMFKIHFLRNYSMTLQYSNFAMCVPMPTHCTITCFGFHARWIDGVECGLFSNHAPLGQTLWDEYLYSVREKAEVRVTVSVTVCVVLLCCVK